MYIEEKLYKKINLLETTQKPKIKIRGGIIYFFRALHQITLSDADELIYKLGKTLNNKNGKINHFLPRNEAIHFDKKDLFIPPYLMGAILGDGSSGNSTNISNVDYDLINRIKQETSLLNCKTTNSGKNIIFNLASNHLYNNKPARPVQITEIQTGNITNYPSIGIAQKYININKSTLHNRCENKLVINVPNVTYESYI